MSDKVKSEVPKDADSAPAKRESEDLVSVARRRAMKVGLAAVPVILTLRGKPLYGQVSDSIAASIAAGSSHHN